MLELSTPLKVNEMGNFDKSVALRIFREVVNEPLNADAHSGGKGVTNTVYRGNLS